MPNAGPPLTAPETLTVDVRNPPSARRQPFLSLLFDHPIDYAELECCEEPGYFSDLNLDQIATSITAGRDEYQLHPYLNRRLDSAEAILFRHEVFRDLEMTGVRQALTAFRRAMAEVRRDRDQAVKLRYRHQGEAWMLDAIRAYVQAAQQLSDSLATENLTSSALVALRDYLNKYVNSSDFTMMNAETRRVSDALSHITYSVHLRGSRVTVGKFTDEADYSTEVEKTFERFKQRGDVKDHRTEFNNYVEMNHVEAQILDQVARLFPSEFAALRSHVEGYASFADETIVRTDREAQFYLAYLDYMDRFRSAGLTFCFPEVSGSTAVSVQDTFDVALADKLVGDRIAMVCNDFELDGQERIFVVTGPNQGGKTTFARTFGQLHHLANIGCPVPGTTAKLFLFDEMFTHFEAEEDLTNLSGKLEDDLHRIQQVLREATSNSIIILNEIFASTTLKDARVLGTRLIEEITARGALAVYVTFIDELASLNEATVSMMSTVVPENPAERTHKVIRKPADGLAFAIAIAERHGLTYRQLRERFTR